MNCRDASVAPQMTNWYLSILIVFINLFNEKKIDLINQRIDLNFNSYNHLWHRVCIAGIATNNSELIKIYLMQ